MESPATGKIEEIAFIDTEASADRCVSLFNMRARGSKKPSVITFAPAISSYLAGKGLDVRNTTPYFTAISHANALKKSEEIVLWLEEKYEHAGLGIFADNVDRDSFISWTRFVFHYCLWAIEIILNAVERHDPDILAASSGGGVKVSSLYLDPEEMYLGNIVEKIAGMKNIEYKNISGSRSAAALFLKNGSLYIRYLARFVFSCLKFEIWEMSARAERIYNPGKRPFFYTSAHYNLEKLARALSAKHPSLEPRLLGGPVISCIKIPDFLLRILSGPSFGDFESKKNKFEKLTRIIRQEAGIFSYRGINFGDIVAQKIEDNIGNYEATQVVWAAKIYSFFKDVTPKMLLSNGERHDDLLLARMCREHDIEGVLISHGSYVPPKDRLEKTEWGEHGRTMIRAPYPYVALQSPLAERYLDAFPSSGAVIRTGPLIWGTPSHPEKASEAVRMIIGAKYEYGRTKVILHAGGSKMARNLRFHVFETPDEYINDLRELAEAVERLRDVYMIIRFRPRTDIDTRDLLRNVKFSEKVLLNTTGSILDILGAADLLVSYSSTAIEEALQNRIPVLLYGGGGKYRHVDAFEITDDRPTPPSAVYHIGKKEYLSAGIENALRHDIKGEHKELFDPFIYKHEERASLDPFLERCLR